jgi:hypothetical protein
MTTNMMHLALPNDEFPFGFRITEDGRLKLMTAMEAQTAIARALNEARRMLRPVHRDHNAVQQRSENDIIADLLRTNERLRGRIAELERPVPEWMKLKYAAFECSLKYEFLRKRVARGDVEARRQGGLWLVNIASLRLRVAQGLLC